MVFVTIFCNLESYQEVDLDQDGSGDHQWLLRRLDQGTAGGEVGI